MGKCSEFIENGLWISRKWLMKCSNHGVGGFTPKLQKTLYKRLQKTLYKVWTPLVQSFQRYLVQSFGLIRVHLGQFVLYDVLIL
jgi:hypothetical protein